MSVERKMKASFNFNTLLFFCFSFFFFFFFPKAKHYGVNRYDNMDQNPGSCHNLCQYLCTKGRHCTENHLKRRAHKLELVVWKKGIQLLSILH